jgi:hypothetical protein
MDRPEIVVVHPRIRHQLGGDIIQQVLGPPCPRRPGAGPRNG